MNIIVVGAGVGGMAAAIRCAQAGHAVTVLEKNPWVGGKLWAHSDQGFTFDCGPSLLTLPTVLEHACGDGYAGLRVRGLEKICRYFWSDGTQITSHTSPEQFADSIARATGERESQYRSYFAQTKRLFHRIAPLFLTHNIRSFSVLKHGAFWRSLPHAPLRMGGITLHNYNRHYFKHTHTQQIFDRFATYIGSSPYRTSAVYSLISFIEHGVGAYFLPAGMRSIPRALKNSAEHKGVKIVLDTRVQKIISHQPARRAHTVVTADHTYDCDALISNIDTLQMDALMGNGTKREYPLARRTTSAIVYLWGVNRTIDRFGLHNVVFSDDYRREFEDIFTRHIAPHDPTIYINISAKETDTDAPPEMENWFVMINVPAISTDWNAVAQKQREKIVTKISRLCGTEIAPHIVYEKILTPPDFADTSCDVSGSLYGKNVHGRWGALGRRSNCGGGGRTGVYHCGGTVHPGGGVPLAILSGQIAAHCVDPRNISPPTL